MAFFQAAAAEFNILTGQRGLGCWISAAIEVSSILK
jgi:hypothetical protein